MYIIANMIQQFSKRPILAIVAKTVFALALSQSLLSCKTMFGDEGWFPSKQGEYLKAKEVEPLAIPEGMDASLSADYYEVPALEFANVLPEKFEIPRVDALGETESRGSVRIQRLTDDRWILLNRSPTQAWPLVLEFLNSNQVEIAQQIAEQGYIETEWLTDRSVGQSLLEKYRFIFTAGVQADTTEILIKQFEKKPGDSSVDINWAKSVSEVKEDNMAKLLAQFLAASPDSVSHSLLAQGLTTANRAAIEYDSYGRPFIALQLSYPRGWASLGLALKKSDFTVADVNRDSGTYYANFEPRNKKEKKRNWLSRTFFPARNKLEDKRGEYQIVIKETDRLETLSIIISREGEEPLKKNEQAFFLNRILTKLS